MVERAENPVVEAMKPFVAAHVEFIDAIKRLCREINRQDAALTASEAEIARIKLHLSAWEDSARINKDRAERAEAEADRLTKALALAILATT